MGSLISRCLGVGIVIKSFTIKDSWGVSHWRQYSGNKYRTSAKIAKKQIKQGCLKQSCLKPSIFAENCDSSADYSIWELAILSHELAILSRELAILLGIFESELGIFGLKLATLEPELAILLGIFEPEHVILESELATLLNRSLQYPSIFSSMVLF